MSMVDTKDSNAEIPLEDLPLIPGGVYRRLLPNGTTAWCVVQGLVMDSRGHYSATVHIPGYGNQLITSELIAKSAWTLVAQPVGV